MSSSPTSAHDALNVSPPPSFTNTLHNSEAYSSDKQITHPPSSYKPSFLRHSDANEQASINETGTFTITPTPITPTPITPTPITPIQPNPSQNPDTPGARHAGANPRNKTNCERLCSTAFNIAFFTVFILGIGALIGMLVISFGCGCTTGGLTMSPCAKVGAAGGAFAFIPTIPALIIARDIYKSTASFCVSAFIVLFIFPLISFGFSLLSAVIGWHIVISIGGVGFQVDVHRAFANVAISTALSYVVFTYCSLRGEVRGSPLLYMR